VDNAPYGIFVADGTGMYLEGNDVACEMIGCTHAELASLGIKDVVYQEDLGLAAASFGSVMQTGRASVECRYQKRSGEVGHWEVIGIKLSDDRVLGFVKDTTAQKKQEDEMRRFEASARQQQKLESIGTLASGVAHEINNPLNVVMNYGQLVLDDPTDPVRVKDYAKNIVNESDRIAVIVRNLLSFARQDKETHSPARIEDIVEQSLSLIRAVLRKEQIDLQCAIPPDLPRVKCRSQQIQQVLMNLLTNARDALNQRYPKAGEDKSIRIDASAFEKDGIRWIRLTVEDHGAGIQPDVADKVFDPFFTTKVRDKGTGLGLAISFGIVKEHHGELWFETEPGKGTRFHMDLRVNNGWSVQNPDEG
jgi:PAS domain S-box-containing protein